MYFLWRTYTEVWRTYACEFFPTFIMFSWLKLFLLNYLHILSLSIGVSLCICLKLQNFLWIWYRFSIYLHFLHIPMENLNQHNQMSHKIVFSHNKPCIYMFLSNFYRASKFTELQANMATTLKYYFTYYKASYPVP